MTKFKLMCRCKFSGKEFILRQSEKRNVVERLYILALSNRKHTHTLIREDSDFFEDSCNKFYIKEELV